MIFFIKDFIKDLKKTASHLNTMIVSGKKMSEVDIKPGSSQVTLISKDNTLKLESDVQNPSIKQYSIRVTYSSISVYVLIKS